jgi:hypothetical protein
MRGSKKKNPFTRALRKKRILILLSLLVIVSVVGYVGWKVYPPFKSQAATMTNPQLTRACGLDVALLVDTSGSMTGVPKANASAGVRSFVNTLRDTDTQFAINWISASEFERRYWIGNPPFTQDVNEVIRRLDFIIDDNTDSRLNDLRYIPAADPRPNRPNLIIILSDFWINYEHANIDAVKQSGTRILALAYNATREGAVQRAIEIAGPNVDTGSIFTSDVVIVNPSTIEAQFQEFARQLCFSGGIPGPAGPSGPGPGTGNGDGGTGAGTNGQGAGAGGGGGGAAATTEADKPNPLPSTANQGDTTEQPKVEPSPFFDGKLFAAGSDGDASISKDKTVGVSGFRIGYGLLVIAALVVLLVVGTFAWWKRMSPAMQLAWKRKLRLKS